MWMHVYRRRQGDYVLVPHPRKHDASTEGALYLGVVAGAAFGPEIGAGIALQLSMRAFAQLTPGQFYGNAPSALHRVPLQAVRSAAR